MLRCAHHPACTKTVAAASAAAVAAVVFSAPVLAQYLPAVSALSSVSSVRPLPGTAITPPGANPATLKEQPARPTREETEKSDKDYREAGAGESMTVTGPIRVNVYACFEALVSALAFATNAATTLIGSTIILISWTCSPGATTSLLRRALPAAAVGTLILLAVHLGEFYIHQAIVLGWWK